MALVTGSRFKRLAAYDAKGLRVGYLRRGKIAKVLNLGTAYANPSAVANAAKSALTRFPELSFRAVYWITGDLVLDMPEFRTTITAPSTE